MSRHLWIAEQGLVANDTKQTDNVESPMRIPSDDK